MIGERARRMGIFLLIAGICLSPRIPLPIEIPGRRFDLRAEDLVLVALLLIWLLAFFFRPRIDSTPLFSAIGLYTSIAALSTCIAMMVGTLTPERASPYFLKELEYFLLFILVANWIRTDSDLRVACNLCLAGALANAAWVAYQVLTSNTRQLLLVTGQTLDPFESSRLLESYGPVLIGESSPLATGGFFLLIFLLAFGFFLSSKPGLWRWLYGALGLSFLACLLWSVSRVSTLGASVGVATMVLSRERKKSVIIPTLIVIVVSIVVMFNPSGTSIIERFRWEAITDSVAFRFREVWQPLLDHGADGLLLGFGKGALGFSRGLSSPEAHNAYLRILLETGFFGMLAFVYLLAKILRVSADGYLKSKRSICRIVCGATMAASWGLSFAALVQDVFTPILLNELWWFLIGLSMAAYRIDRHLKKEVVPTAAVRSPSRPSELLRV